MNQGGGGNWTHAISNDLVRWFHIADALQPNKSSSWDQYGPCDGTVSFPDLGEAPFNGSTPVIMYGPDCTVPISQRRDGRRVREAAGGRGRVGDAPRLEVALPADPSDPALSTWAKLQPGPARFSGAPCAFPGRVWRSKVGPYYNMLCALDHRNPHGDAQRPWARFTSTDRRLMHWQLANNSAEQHHCTNQYGIPCSNFIHSPTDKAPWYPAETARSGAGALFHKIPGHPPDGPSHLISSSTGGTFMLGNYNSTSEMFTVTQPNGQVTVTGSYGWAAAGTNGPDPDADNGRLLTAAWVVLPGPRRVVSGAISLMRSLRWDSVSKQLVSSPVSEYTSLRNQTFVSTQTGGEIPAGGKVDLPIPAAGGGAVDVLLTIEPGPSAVGMGLSVKSGAAKLTIVGVDTVAGGHSVSLVINTTNDTTWDPVHEFNAGPPNAHHLIFVAHGETIDIRAMVDRPIVEWFVNGGRAAHVAVSPFNPREAAVAVFNLAQSARRFKSVAAYGIGCGWASTKPVPLASIQA